MGKEEAKGSKEESKEEVKEESKEDAKEEAKEEPKKEEDEEEDDDMGDEPPKVELTEEDKKTFFSPTQTKDLLDQVLAESFGNFSIPDKSEGFDEIKFEWQNEAKSGEYVNTWRKQKKI